MSDTGRNSNSIFSLRMTSHSSWRHTPASSTATFSFVQKHTRTACWMLYWYSTSHCIRPLTTPIALSLTQPSLVYHDILARLVLVKILFRFDGISYSCQISLGKWHKCFRLYNTFLSEHDQYSGRWCSPTYALAMSLTKNLQLQYLNIFKNLQLYPSTSGVLGNQQITHLRVSK